MQLELETIDGEEVRLGCDALLTDADETIYTGYEVGPVEVARRVALTEFGYQVPPFERMRGLAGEHALVVIGKFQDDEMRSRLSVDWPKINARFREELRMPPRLHVLPDAEALLQNALALNLPTAIVTNSSHSSWVEKGGKLPSHVVEAVRTVVTMTCVGDKPKPYPDMLHEGARRSKAQKAVLFGDAKADARAARNAGIPSVIRRAGREEDQLKWIRDHGAYIVEDFSRVRIVD